MSEDDESTDSEYEYYDEDTEEDTIHKRAYRHVNDRQIYCALMDKKKELWIEVHDLRKVPPTIGDLVHLRSLTISSNQFLYVLPPQIGKLESLRVLKIHHNSLCQLPDEIGDLRQLRYLNVSYNKLTTLPSTTGRLRKLETLNVKENRLTSLPPSIRELDLVDLMIGGNPIHQGKSSYGFKLSSLPDDVFV